MIYLLTTLAIDRSQRETGRHLLPSLNVIDVCTLALDGDGGGGGGGLHK